MYREARENTFCLLNLPEEGIQVSDLYWDHADHHPGILVALVRLDDQGSNPLYQDPHLLYHLLPGQEDLSKADGSEVGEMAGR